MQGYLALKAARLSSLPGVGARVESKLVAFFGSEAEALEAIAWCRLSLLGEALGKAVAHRLVHGVYRLAYGRWPRDIAATDEAWHLFLEARKLVESMAYTPVGRDILACSLPLPPSGLADAAARLELLSRAAGFQNIDSLLERVGHDIAWPRPGGRVRVNRLLVVVGDRAAYEKAVERLGAVLEVAYAGDPAEVAEHAESRDDVVVYDPYGIYTGPYPVAETLSLEEVAPEVYVERLRSSWRVLSAVARLAREAGSDTVAGIARSFGFSVEASDVDRLVEAADLLRGGDVSEDFDEAYARLRRALARLDTVVDDVEVWANDLLRKEMERLEVRIPAARLLEILASIQRGEPPPSIELPEEIVELFSRVAEAAVRRIVDELGLDEHEASLARNIVPETPSYPFTLNRDAVNDLRSALAAKLAAKRLEVMRRLAAIVKGLDRVLTDVVQAIALLDAGLAPLRLRRRGVPVAAPETGSWLGVGFRNAVEAGLAARLAEGSDGVQPVTYYVGEVPAENPTRGEPVAILTGANSGGKTTLLKTLAETVMLGQAGLPVYAEKAWVGFFDRIFFLSKPQGEVSAGALEAMLRMLADAATTPGRILVLVDEFEAATEAGAAARIVAGFIAHLLSRGNAVAVIVSHLADAVTSNLPDTVRSRVRVDGIEAKGLDENYNLVVDRNPRFYFHARSMPELVVMKLALTSRERREREFYQRLLEMLSGRRP